ncbi:MAG: glycine zipper 2TM domain-containing protein [Magnetococcales bacterium]|nr:glycine zipper 2TM domain-containing protein [Magnetococcales bacterium]
MVSGLIILGLVGGGLSGCANQAQTGAGVGALGGALAGSLLGPSKNKEQWALIGGAIGALAGYTIGNEMDKNDHMRVGQAYESSPSYQTTRWHNPDTGRDYAVTPRPAYETQQGQWCREAEVEAVIDGKRETMVTTACRGADGRWQARK